MGFYDNWDFDGLKFFSNLKTRQILVTPSKDFISIVKKIKSSDPQKNITVAEIGVGYGATTLQVLKLLGENDTYYCFDFEDRIQDLTSDLKAKDFGVKCRVVPMGNSHYTGDSYNWNLSNLIFDMRERHEAGIFDAVYLDGAHTLLHDGLAVCLLKELLRDNGILILDDVHWTIANSKTVRDKAIKAGIPKDQMEDRQVFRVQELFLSNDPNFERLSPPNAYRGIFRKRPR